MKPGFYKLDQGVLLYASTEVSHADYNLLSDLHDTYQYPVGGWRWFDSKTEAVEFLGTGID
jgi:hypothetical protein